MVPVLAAAAHLYSLPYAPPKGPEGLLNDKTGSRIDCVRQWLSKVYV